MKKKIIILLLVLGFILVLPKNKTQQKQDILQNFVTAYLNSKADQQVELKDKDLIGEKKKFRLEALKNVLTYNVAKANTLNLKKGKLVAAFEAAENGYHLKANNRLSIYDNGLLILRYNHQHYYLMLSANDIFNYQNYLTRLKDFFIVNNAI